MFKRLLVLFVASILLVSFFNTNTFAATQSAEPAAPTIENLDITPKDSLSKTDIKDILSGEKYDYLEFSSSFNIGSDTLVDKVSKTAVDNLDNLDLDHFNNRQQMLSVMLDKQEKVADTQTVPKDQKEQIFKTSDITNAAKTNIISGLPKFDKLKITRQKLPNQSQNNNLINRIKSNSKVKEVKSAILDQQGLDQSQSIASKSDSTNSSNQTQSSNNTNSSPSSKPTNLIQNLQSAASQIKSTASQIGSNLTNLTKPITAEAAAGNQDWIPSYTNISFFDTSEIQLEPFKDYQSIEGATDKGIGTAYSSSSSKFYILKKDQDSGMSLASIDQDGNNLTPWTKQSGSTQEGVTLATFNSKLFEGHVGSDKGQVWIRSSSDNGITWSSWSNPSNRQTGHAFAMTQFKNQLCIMHNGYGYGSNNYNGFNDNNTKIYIGCSSDGVTFPTWEQVGAGSYSSPSMVEANGYLYQSHRGMDKNQVWIRKCTGMNRGCDSWYWVKNGQSAEAIALTSVKSTPNTTTNDRICLMIKPIVDTIQTQPELQYTCNKNYDFNTFQPWKRSGDNTTNLAPSLSYAPGTGQLTASQLSQGNLAQFHIGLDGKVNYRVLPASSSTSVPSNQIKRGYYSGMRWDSPNFPNSLGFSTGYEQDVYLYYGQNTTPTPYSGYLDRQDNWFCLPNITYSFSSLPNYYIDTRLDNPDPYYRCSSAVGKDFTDYTIGTPDGNQIQAGKTYFNYWLDSKGQRDKPIFQLNAQKQERRALLYCVFGMTWCMYPIESKTMICTDPNIYRGSNYPCWYKENYKQNYPNNC